VEAMAAGFYNIDIDTSTLVDLSRPMLEEQQQLNFELCADFTRFIREHEPKGVTVSVGGEIGEVGQKNSTPQDLEAFMCGYRDHKGSITGISKISIQTGTSHGGVVLPDGTLADVALDFDVLRLLSEKARKEFGLGGAVQHGASTLPDSLFHAFPTVETAEIHLATGFQNAVYEHPAFPADLHAEIESWCFANAADERKDGMTDSQFVYTSRKKAIGPFKRRLWSLPRQDEILASQAAKIAFLFDQLKVTGTADLLARYVPSGPEWHRPVPEALKAATGG